MLKQTVVYTDYNDKQQTEELYFNLTKTEMLDMLDLQPRMEAWRNRVPNSGGELSIPDILEMLEIIKDLIQKAYGERSADGKFFRKSPEIFANFQQSAVYDAFLFELFQDPERSIEFMIGILPKDLAEETSKQISAATNPQEVSLPTVPENTLTAVDQEVPAYIREDRDPTPAEMRSMSQPEIIAAFARKNRS